MTTCRQQMRISGRLPSMCLPTSHMSEPSSSRPFPKPLSTPWCDPSFCLLVCMGPLSSVFCLMSEGAGHTIPSHAPQSHQDFLSPCLHNWFVASRDCHSVLRSGEFARELPLQRSFRICFRTRSCRKLHFMFSMCACPSPYCKRNSHCHRWRKNALCYSIAGPLLP